MTLLIDNRTDFELTDEIKEMLEKVCLKSLQYEEFNEDCEISLSIVTNDEIHDINKQFRNIDSPTDVLSFPQLTFEEGEEADVNENGEIVLGDIIISIDRAKEQAEEYGHSLKRELAFLSVHSMLHLMGYDHMVPEEEEDMFRRQKEILIEAGIPRE
ncbi:MAG: rRNA maturation RNase YbeY [Clostridiales bacterium]|nr:rRNA maturation RNase YbeY [Clostridiales bacterium]